MQDAAVRDHGRPDPVATRRRAVFTGLIPHLQGADLYTALWLWQDKYSNGPAMALHRFINEFARMVTYDVRRSDLHLSLVMAMNKDVIELAPDPYPDMIAYRERHLPSAKLTTIATGDDSALTPATVILESVLQAVFHQLDEEFASPAEKLRRYLSQHLVSVGLELGAFIELSQWLSGLRSHLSRSYSEAHMRALLHVIYVGGCQYLGPIYIDTLLAHAIEEAERLPEAVHFAPRRLL